jgi:cytochrome P450
MVARLREECPVVHSNAHGGFWVITRYADVLNVLQDWRRFTSTEGVTVPRVQTPLRALPMEVDPPEHVGYRHALNPHLTVHAVARYEDGIRAIVDEQIDAFIDDGHCDLVAQFAGHIPSHVLFKHLLDAPEEDIAQCHEWVAAWAYDPASNEAAEAGIGLAQFCYRMVSERRAALERGEQRGDILDAIVTTEVNDRPIDDMEGLGVVALLIFGGFDTTANGIANAMVYLCEHPDLQDRLREHPELMPAAVEEFLRLDPPVIGLARRATCDVELAGQTIRAGDAVYFSLASANHDPSEFDSPDVVDPDRQQNRHLAFSAGVHRCAGAHLGRLMMRIALEQLLARLGDIRIGAEFEYNQATARGPKTLPLTFTRR